MTRRRWIADTWNEQRTSAALLGDQAAHLARVLRAQPGQVFDVVANGFLHRAEVASVNSDEVTFTLHEEQQADAALPIHLLLAVFKFDRFEWAIEKATELGVARITPILAHRTEKHLAQAAHKRVERWKRIAHEASQQSRRSDIPAFDDPLRLGAAIASSQDARLRILLSETEQQIPLTSALWDALDSNVQVNHIALAVGPEGGWTSQEMDSFAAGKWQHVTLGPRILRAETAAIAALAITASQLL